jgi:predicted Zn-dependent protease
LRRLLAEIRWNRGDDAEAGRILDELISEDPTDHAARLARGLLYDQTGSPDRAIPLLREVYVHDPGRKRVAGYRLGQALGHAGRQAEAEQVLAEVRRILDIEMYADATGAQPANLDMRVRLAEAVLRDGHPPDGIQMLEAILRTAPGYAPAHRALADYYARTGRAEMAARHRQLAEGPP